MKQYKLIYNYSSIISDFIERNQDEFMSGLTYEQKRKESEDIIPNRYAWYEENEIYSENENFDGEAIKVSKLVELYPDDWEEQI